jgi:hypothetical protein
VFGCVDAVRRRGVDAVKICAYRKETCAEMVGCALFCSGETEVCLRGHLSKVSVIHILPRSRRIVTGSWDKYVAKFWHLAAEPRS